MIALLTLCAMQVGAVEVQLRLPDEVDLGRAFPFELARSWPRDEFPEAWDPATLAPLIVETKEVRREIVGDRVVESRRMRGWVFALDELEVLGVPLKVATQLDAVDRGEVELPESPAVRIPPRVRVARGLLVAAGLVAVAAGVTLRRRRRIPIVVPRDPAEDLCAWRGEVLADVEKLRASLHGALSWRLGGRLEARTVGELSEVPELRTWLGDREREALSELGRLLDRTRYTGDPPSMDALASRAHAIGEALSARGAVQPEVSA